MQANSEIFYFLGMQNVTMMWLKRHLLRSRPCMDCLVSFVHPSVPCPVFNSKTKFSKLRADTKVAHKSQIILWGGHTIDIAGCLIAASCVSIHFLVSPSFPSLLALGLPFSPFHFLPSASVLYTRHIFPLPNPVFWIRFLQGGPKIWHDYFVCLNFTKY